MLKIKKIKPLFSAVVVTKEYYTEDELAGSLIDPNKAKGTLKEFQKVVAVGNMARFVKVGDFVKINPSRFAVYKDKRSNSVVNNLEEYHNQIVGYNIPTVEISGVDQMLIQENDIEYVIEDYEDVPASKIIQPDKSVVVS